MSDASLGEAVQALMAHWEDGGSEIGKYIVAVAEAWKRQQRPANKPKRAADNKPMSATRAFLNDLAIDIDTALNNEPLKPGRKNAFVLLTFPFRAMEDAAPRCNCNYVSNGVDRRDMIVLFKELIARFEGQPKPKDPTVIQ